MCVYVCIGQYYDEHLLCVYTRMRMHIYVCTYVCIRVAYAYMCLEMYLGSISLYIYVDIDMRIFMYTLAYV